MVSKKTLQLAAKCDRMARARATKKREKNILQLAADCRRSALEFLSKQPFVLPRMLRPPFDPSIVIDSKAAFRYASSPVIQDCFQVLRLAHALKTSGGTDVLAAYRLAQAIERPQLRDALKVEKGREKALAARRNKTEGPRAAFRARYVAALKAHPNWTNYGLCIELRKDSELTKVLRKMPSLNTTLRWTQDLPPHPRRKRS